VVLEKDGEDSWTDHVRNEEVLLTVKEQRNILPETGKGKFNWIGHIVHRNCLLRHVIKGKVKGGTEWQKDEEEDVGNCWLTLRKGEDTYI
jgi:hypothetical protein